MANERDTALTFVDQVLANCATRNFKAVTFFAVLDNACQDGTVDILQAAQAMRPQLRVVWSPENRYVVDAYLAGYAHALHTNCQWILEIDAGFSHQPSEIGQFFDRMSEGLDCVFGSRFVTRGCFEDAPYHRYVISRGGSILTNLLLGTRLTDMTSGFELFKAEALRKVLDKGISSRGHFFQTEIRAFCSKLNVLEVPIHYRAPSKSVGVKELLEAFANLYKLVAKRWHGDLFIHA